MIKKEWVIAPFPKSTVWEVLQGQTAVYHVAPWMLSTELSLVQVALSELNNSCFHQELTNLPLPLMSPSDPGGSGLLDPVSSHPDAG